MLQSCTRIQTVDTELVDWQKQLATTPPCTQPMVTRGRLPICPVSQSGNARSGLGNTTIIYYVPVSTTGHKLKNLIWAETHPVEQFSYLGQFVNFT